MSNDQAENRMGYPDRSPKRVLFLATSATYGTSSFATAARKLGLEVVLGIDMPEQLAEYWCVPLGLDFNDPQQAVQNIVTFARERPLDAILSVDDSGSVIAALASAALSLPHNDPEAALAARNKYRMRERLQAGGVPCPGFRRFSADDDPSEVARQIDYPCVVKPLLLSASRGVIRADDPNTFVKAFRRLARMLPPGERTSETRQILVEDFIPGVEVALEGILTDGILRVLALFDKPDPLDGPFFEETIYVTPSRLPSAVQDAIRARTQQSAAALGLRHGPIHAELRINAAGPWLIEAAGRSIGGLCSRILQFGLDTCLEELVLRHAVGMEIESLEREAQAAGVMMIPIPKAGILRGVAGINAATDVPGIEGVEITAKLNYPLVPLPEGSSYLGFIFARGHEPAAVEASLREAHAKLRFEIEEPLPIFQ